MEKVSSAIFCDGCGASASPEHIAQRLARLELSSRFRPVHISVLFVALAPGPHPGEDFYNPAGSKKYFDAFLDAAGVGVPAGKSAPSDNSARLIEFQRKGYYFVYLSECPIPANTAPASAANAALGQTLIRRIRFNYKPKRIAMLGAEAAPLIAILRQAGLGPMVLQDRGKPLNIPEAGDLSACEKLQAALSSVVTDENPDSGYDRISVEQV